MDDDGLRWISHAILPHESDVRRWLHRYASARIEADDLIQECYARIARGTDPSMVRNARAYFFRVAKNLLIEIVRRQKLIRIEALAEIDASLVIDEQVPADQQVQDREELSFVMTMMERLPPTSREILYLRRVEGLSQRETASRLGISENVVEKRTGAGLRRLVELMRDAEEMYGFPPREIKARGATRISG